jgi:hypothetical protein
MEWLDNIGKDSLYDENIEALNISLDDAEDTEWLQDRLGMVTGSNFGKLVVKSKDKKSYVLSTGATATGLIYKIAWERLLKNGNISNGLGRLSVSSKAMQHGNDFEGQAIVKYMKYTGLKVDYAQKFIKLDDFIGGTPDGFIGDDGLIEVKCPFNGGNHLKSLLTKQIYNTEFVYQMQGYLWVTDRKWCDFVTYDPDLIEGLQLNIIRVERDDEMIEAIKLIMEQVKEKLNEIINNEKLKL